ncbi:Innexin shaking-B, partial [Gonioctena quinquepunctata]
DIPEDVLNTYCWIHSTFTIEDDSPKGKTSEVALAPAIQTTGDHPTKQFRYYQWVELFLFIQCARGSGLRKDQSHIYETNEAVPLVALTKCRKNIIPAADQFSPEKNPTLECTFPGSPGVRTSYNDKEKKVYKYYQWVCFCLFFQAILFYAPRWLWKSWEGGKIHALMMDLDVAICTEIEKKQKKKLMLDYLWENLRYHNWWAYKYYFCEILALANVIGQMFLMNRFFDGAFLMFGFEVLSFINADQEDRMDPMIQIFPRMTKCTFRKYGVSGDEEKHDALCILPLNVVNEKIYVFLWFWFVMLSVLTFFTVIYRIVIIFSPRMRVYLLRMRYRLVRQDVIDTIVRRSKLGDWFLFYMLGENVDSLIFRDVMQELAHKLNRHDFHHGPGFKGEIQEA